MYLKNPLILELAKFIVKESESQDIYIVCNSSSDCRGFVLMETFDNVSSHVGA